MYLSILIFSGSNWWVSSSCLMEVFWRALAGKCWQCGISADSHHPTTPAQTSRQIMSHFPHLKNILQKTTTTATTKPIKKNETHRNTLFLCPIRISIRLVRVVRAQLPGIARRPSSTWRAVTRLPESRVGLPTPLEWKFCLETPRFTKPWSWKHGKSSHAKHGGFFSARKQHWTNVELSQVQKFGCKWKCLGFWKKETKLVTQVRWVNVAVYVFTCTRAVVENASCNWNISISSRTIQQSSTIFWCPHL